MVLKALIVDDESIILDLLQIVLERKDYDVTRATDGDKAIKILDTEVFDLVITDLQMGQTSGLDVLQKTKNPDFGTIAFMITGCCEASCEIDAYHHGADDFFLKPFSIKDLIERIQIQELKHFNPAPSHQERKRQRVKVSEYFPTCKAISPSVQDAKVGFAIT